MPFAKSSKRTLGKRFLKYARNCLRSVAGSAAAGSAAARSSAASSERPARKVIAMRSIPSTHGDFFFAGFALVVAPRDPDLVAGRRALDFDLDQRVLGDRETEVGDRDFL